MSVWACKTLSNMPALSLRLDNYSVRGLVVEQDAIGVVQLANVRCFAGACARDNPNKAEQG